MNDSEREMWVDNDAGLYGWWRSSRKPKRVFVRENRAEIDEAIVRVLGQPPVGGDAAASHARAQGLVYGRGVR